MSKNKLTSKFKFVKRFYYFLEKIIFNILNYILPQRLIYYFFKNKIYVKKNKKKIFSLRNYSQTCKWRAQTFFKKEPDTIKWIDAFDENETFLDIGANIGVYSLYAASKVSKVWSIEPESLNFAMLNLNIYDNELFSKITALPIALYKESKIEKLNLQSLEWGDALNSFENLKDQFGKNFEPMYKQGSYSITLDELIKKIGKIEYMKIDVDGNEEEIINGGENSIKNKIFKSILIELDENLENYEVILNKMSKYGYNLKSKTSSTFIPEIFGSTKNHIFYSD